MFYLFLLAHLVADFLLQPLWLVLRKRRWGGLLIHVGLVTLCMLPIPLVAPRGPGLWLAIAAIAAIHLAADRWKVRCGDRLFRDPLTPFLLDQAIHVGTLALVLSVALPADVVWGLDASPLAGAAILASAYIVAAVAAPIAVIVGADPQFRHAALAGRARTRSLVRAGAAMTLALLAGPLAAPLTLIGLAVALRRPASAHPLDAPGGLILVLCVAASLGALLALMR